MIQTSTPPGGSNRLQSSDGKVGVDEEVESVMSGKIRLAGNHRIIGKARILLRIGHLQQRRTQNGMCTKGDLTRRFGDLLRQADTRLEPLPVGIDQADQRNRLAVRSNSNEPAPSM